MKQKNQDQKDSFWIIHSNIKSSAKRVYNSYLGNARMDYKRQSLVLSGIAIQAQPQQSTPKRSLSEEDTQNSSGAASYNSLIQTSLLRKFITEQGRIVARRTTSLKGKTYKKVTKAIKQGRILAILPFGFRGLSGAMTPQVSTKQRKNRKRKS